MEEELGIPAEKAEVRTYVRTYVCLFFCQWGITSGTLSVKKSGISYGNISVAYRYDVNSLSGY